MKTVNGIVSSALALALGITGGAVLVPATPASAQPPLLRLRQQSPLAQLSQLLVYQFRLRPFTIVLHLGEEQ